MNVIYQMQLYYNLQLVKKKIYKFGKWKILFENLMRLCLLFNIINYFCINVVIKFCWEWVE
jgi:hypothetical protein